MARTVNEKSPLYMTIVFTDEVGDPLVPTKAEWRLDDHDNDSQVVDWTTLASPASTMNMIIEGTNHIIGDETNVKEKRVYGIRVNGGGQGEAYDEFHYNIVNLHGALSP